MTAGWTRSCNNASLINFGISINSRPHLNLSGMRWTEASATGTLTLRCLEASARWDENLPATRTTHAV